jgi:ribonuclease J
MARELGIPADNIAVVENGTIIEFHETGMSIGERVPGGYVFVDGAMVGDIGPAVLRDRESLARDGFVVAMVNRSPRTGQLLGRPRLVSRGFVYLPDADELMKAAEDVLISTLADEDDDWERLIQSQLGQFLYRETKRRPVIIPVINEIPI